MTPQEAAHEWNTAGEGRYYKANSPTNVPGSRNFADDMAAVDIGGDGAQSPEQAARWAAFLEALDSDYQRTMARNWFATQDVSKVIDATPPAPEVPAPTPTVVEPELPAHTATPLSDGTVQLDVHATDARPALTTHGTTLAHAWANFIAWCEQEGHVLAADIRALVTKL